MEAGTELAKAHVDLGLALAEGVEQIEAVDPGRDADEAEVDRPFLRP